METRPGDPKHGDFARGGETLPRDERLGSFVNGEETDVEAYSFACGWSGDGDG